MQQSRPKRSVGNLAAPIMDAATMLARTARRPGTYPAVLRELGTSALNLGLMPAGLVREALKIEDSFRLSDRYTPGHALRYLDPEAASTPIILLHGYFHNRSAFVVMRRTLKRAGFRTVDTINYNPFTHGIEDLARSLSEHVEEVLDSVEAHQVHLIGHSLGGLVARFYVQHLGGDQRVHTCMTLGTPHQGTYSAYIGRGRAAREIRPNSSTITELNSYTGSPSTRFVSFYSNLDGMILPASNAKLTVPSLNAENVLVKDLGHQSLLVSKPVARLMIDRLIDLHAPVQGSVAGGASNVSDIRS